MDSFNTFFSRNLLRSSVAGWLARCILGTVKRLKMAASRRLHKVERLYSPPFTVLFVYLSSPWKQPRMSCEVNESRTRTYESVRGRSGFLVWLKVSVSPRWCLCLKVHTSVLNSTRSQYANGQRSVYCLVYQYASMLHCSAVAGERPEKDQVKGLLS